MNFNDEQLRNSENLAMAYDAWLDNERVWREHVHRLKWKTVNGSDYLYRIVDRDGRGPSLGPKSPELEQHFDQYMAKRDASKTARKRLSDRVQQVSRLCRALRLPAVDSMVGRLLREADLGRLLGDVLAVVGTNAMVAYAYAARRLLPSELQSTADFDIAWTSPKEAFAVSGQSARPIMDLLKAVDGTFTVNTERTFQARNADAFEVELLAAPSVTETLARSEPLRPVGNLQEQEWLLLGTPIREIVRTSDADAAAIVAPDPRWFALHKRWLATKPERNRKKVDKDAAQGTLLWSMAKEGLFPLSPVDADFIAALPDALRPFTD